MSLIVSFEGWCLIRLATDPDPSDEPRGVSGYTFAFPGEPDFDRIVQFQPNEDLVRVGWPSDWTKGVRVNEAASTARSQPIDALVGAAVHLDEVPGLGKPKLENRNWTLTLPGQEPIVPFKLRIERSGVLISRYAPLDPKRPDMKVWQANAKQLENQGANGINYEPQTVGRATGIWDSVAVAKRRLEYLQERAVDEHDLKKGAALEGRIRELRQALASAETGDRRIGVRYCVERFAFEMDGPPGTINDPNELLRPCGSLDVNSPWTVSFWMGAWDADLLCAFVQGSLEIPVLSPSAHSRHR